MEELKLKEYVGILQQMQNGGVVILDQNDPELGREILIPKKHLNGAPFGMKVVCVLSGTAYSPYGKIVEVLGDPQSADVGIRSIIRSLGLSEVFRPEVLAEIEDLGQDPSEAEVDEALRAGRKDLRALDTVTIDGLDARDLDDAIDIEETVDGDLRLWVHIADVAHYVHEGTELDMEARERGNSVYLVDRVLPMLPPKLSNGLCSLNPGKTRLALTCELLFNRDAVLKEGRVYESVIMSKYRSSYEEVKAVCEETAEADADRPLWYADKVKLMRKLSDRLTKQRQERGSLDFDLTELELKLDSAGKVLEILERSTDFSHGIIESFMLAANEYVAKFCEEKSIQVVYRVHELPDEEKILTFTRLARIYGAKIKVAVNPSAEMLRAVIQSFRDRPYSHTLSHVLLRAMAKARYDAKDLGHYALAADSYCHFTAPIRRYSDCFTHRSLKCWLNRSGRQSSFALAERIAEHVSETERKAVTAERASVDRKVCEYMTEHLGEVFQGTISGFSQGNFFVRLENGIEGAVAYRNLDGYYRYIPEYMVAVNERSGVFLCMGDAVSVQVASVDLNRRFIDFALLEHRPMNGVQFDKLKMKGNEREDKRGKKGKPGSYAGQKYGKKAKKAKQGSSDKRKSKSESTQPKSIAGGGNSSKPVKKVRHF